MLPSLRSLILSKRLLAVYAAGTVFFVWGVWGFWKWAHMPPSADEMAMIDERTLLLTSVILPFLLFVMAAVYGAASAGHRWSSAGFQFRIDELQKRLNAQDDFFHILTDHTPSALTIFNGNNEYWFVNSSSATALGAEAGSIMGKTPSALLGASRGRRIEKRLDQVRTAGQQMEFLNREIDEHGQVHYIQTSYQPMLALGGVAGGILAREEDVTTIVLERERREHILRQVISTLVAVVDRRDPYASGHSARVGMLSRALAVEMALPERDVEAAEIAGSLMNFGKVLVSRSILTKTEGLRPEELRRIREGILTSADILSMIDFGAPVVPTLQQVLERFDGNGVPNNLKGEEILMTARLVAVANAFIALVSPRAYRPGMDPVKAASRLAEESGKAFDPRAISALETYIGKNDKQIDWLTAGKSA